MFGFMECKVNNAELASQTYRTRAFVTAKPEDFIVGAEIECPSGLGGTFTTKVTKIKDGIATCVKPYCCDHDKQTFLVYVQPPAITINQLLDLQTLMKTVNRRAANGSMIDYDLLSLARVNGLIVSYNEWSYTDLGVSVLAALKDYIALTSTE
jgi:hypothetical protein